MIFPRRETPEWIWVIPTPAGRRGWDVWVGPVGVSLTLPMARPAWNWGWWHD